MRRLIVLLLLIPSFAFGAASYPQGPPVNQYNVGRALWPLTSQESTAGLTWSSILPYYAPLNALRYKCDATGATDSSSCFTNLGAVLNAAGGGTGEIPCGTYQAGNVSFPYNRIFLHGAGTNCVFLRNNTTNHALFTWGDGTNSYFDGGISGVAIAGNTGVTGVNGQYGLLFQKIGQFRIDDVFVSNSPTSLHRGVYFSNASQFHVSRLRVQGCLSDGVTFQATTDSYVDHSRSDANAGNGFAFTNAQGVFATQDTAYNNNGVAWALVSASPSTAPNFNDKFLDIVADTSGSYNIQVADCINCTFVNPWASSQQSTGVNTSADGMIIANQYSKGILIQGGQFLNNNAHGLHIFDPGSSPPTYITVQGAQYGSTQNGSNGNGRAGAGYGLNFNGSTNHIRILGGLFDGNASGAIQNQSAQTDISICGNPVGFTSTNQGSATVAVSSSSVAVTHGLGFTPNAANILVTPTSSLAASGINSYWISAVSASTFTVSTNANVTTSAFNFVWRAGYNGC